MNILSGAIRYVAGSDTSSAVVPRLVDRVASSALPRDRRDALAALAAAAATDPATQAEVGERALKVTYASLEQDRDFDDTLRAVVDLLVNVCCVLEPPPPDPALSADAARDARDAFVRQSAAAAGTNTDAFLGMPNAMVMLLDLLETSDLFIRCRAIELLTAMTANSRDTVQAAVLEAPEAVARLTDLLSDSNPIVVANATLLLSALSEASAEICKIIAFSGVLETIFRIMLSALGSSPVAKVGDSADRRGNAPDRASETPLMGAGVGASAAGATSPSVLEDLDPEGAIQVQDSLRCVLTLLEGSSVTQSFLRDSGCIPRLARVLSLVADSVHGFETGGNLPPAALAVAQHYRSSLRLALGCVRRLVELDNDDSSRNRSLCASAGVLRTVLQLCFPSRGRAVGATGFSEAEVQPESEPDASVSLERMSLRISAFSTATALVYGNEDMRTVFTSPLPALSGHGTSAIPQLIVVETVLSDHSAAVRAAAFQLLRSTLLADRALDLPATALLNALVGDGGIGQHAGASASALSSNMSFSTLAGVAAALKSAVVGWPNDADGAGVFYAASVICWVAARIRGARERLLSAYVSGSGDALLARSVRSLGQAVREEGPPAARIGLLRLICTWLYDSPSAVSAFLSSAMHLPLLLELVMKNRSRSDAVSSVHVQGLAALVLGICLECADGDGRDGQPSDSGFVSGMGGASVVIPRATIVDIIRNRIGVSTFTARLDELRSSHAFTAAAEGAFGSASPSELSQAEKLSRARLRSRRGDLGHELWYDKGFVELVDDVYGKIGAHVLHLVAEDRISSAPHSKPRGLRVEAVDGKSYALSGSGVNGDVRGSGPASVPQSVTPSGAGLPLIESSSRDDVLLSYKDLIRNQDTSLSEARTQLKELEAALREAHLELDAKNRNGADGAGRDERERLTSANSALTEKAAALEAMLQEKNDEFAALSSAYSALESMQGSADIEDALAERDHLHNEQMDHLRAEKAAAVNQLYEECDKVARLERAKLNLELSEQRIFAQLEAIKEERDVLRGDGGSEVVSAAAEWRRRAEVGEREVSMLSAAFKKLEGEQNELSSSLRSAEVERDELRSRAAAAEETVAKLQSEVAKVEASRNRELQMARESASFADRSAKDEILRLRNELEEARARSSEGRSSVGADGPSSEALTRERNSALARIEVLSSELMDFRNSIAEWKQRAENFESEAASVRERNEELARSLEREKAETLRLTAATSDSQLALTNLRADLESKETDFTSVSKRVLELEEQCTDLEEMRERDAEELGHLREEVASRAEQTIRLSGKVYEAEEARVVAEAKMEEAQERVRELEGARDVVGTSAPVEDAAVASQSPEDVQHVSALDEEIVALKGKIASMQELLDDANDKLGMSSAIAHDRDEALKKLETLEHDLTSIRAEKNAMESRIIETEDQLMSLGEAENAKRVLTERVGELQKALSEAEAATKAASESGLSSKVLTLSKPHGANMPNGVSELEELRRELEEKTMELSEVRGALAAHTTLEVEMKRSFSELEKRLSESEALLSVVSAEKSEQSARISELEHNLHDLEAEKSRLLEESQALQRQAEESRTVSERDDVAAEASLGHLRERIFLMEKKELELTEQLENSRNEVVESRGKAQEMTSTFAELENAMSSRNSEIQDLRDQLQVAAGNRTSAENDREKALVELNALRDAAKDADSEIQQLKEALSDAAKTFKLSAKELAQREELLVEISRDKTEVTDELARAREEIESLRKEQMSAGEAFETEKRRLVEYIKDVERKMCELESSLTSVQKTSECGSLDTFSTSVDMSITCDLVEGLDARLRELEERHASLAVSKSADHHLMNSLTQRLNDAEAKLQLSTIAAKALEDDLRASSSARESELLMEVQSVRAEFASYKVTSARTTEEQLRLSSESEENLVKAKSELEQLRVELATVKSDLSSQLEARESEVRTRVSEVTELQARVSYLTSELRECELDLEGARSRNSVLEKETREASDRVTHLESEAARLTSRISELALERASGEATLKTQISAMESQHEFDLSNLRDEIQSLTVALNTSKASLEAERESHGFLEESSAKRIADLESEIGACHDALEMNDRELRDLKKSSKKAREQSEAVVSSLEMKSADLSAKLATKAAEIVSAENKFKEETASLGALVNSTRDKLFEQEAVTKGLRAEVEAANKKSSSLQELLSDASERLRSSTAHCDSLESFLTEVTESRDSLRIVISERAADLDKRNHTIEELRQSLTVEKESTSSLRDSLSEERGKVSVLEGKNLQLGEEVDRLRRTRGRLEEETDTLQAELDASESARATLEKDNADLRAWVGDLEEQANGLQNLVEKFEDVERNLDEAVAAHHAAVESNEAKSEKMDALGRELEDAASETRVLRAEKDAAESAQALARSQVTELEARLLGIRSSHATKLSSMEDKIKSTVQRCAELESSLATAERQLAESATLSDKIFNIETQLSRTQAEAAAGAARAEAAEAEVEDVRREMVQLRKELDESRATEEHEAYKTLEAEHNELLICLAELELEYTQLRDSTIGAAGSRTYESVSAR